MSELARLYGGNLDRRRVARSERKNYDPQNLWEHHHEILNLLAMGFRPHMIAEKLGVHVQTVSNIRNSTLGREKLKLLRATRDAEAVNVKEEVAKLLGPALKVYEKILSQDGEPTELMKKTADTVLMDIGGYAAPKQVQGAFCVFSPQELEELKERGIREAKAAGILVEEVKEE